VKDFGRYKIAEEIGRGAMGVVYRAVDPMIGRTVAIKSINSSFVESVGVAAAEYFERFRREAEVAGRLNHPHIVKVYDLGPTYIVMEFVEGQSLATAIRSRTNMQLSAILSLVADVADALDYAHRSGVVHRDIKPANIMVQPDGTVKVMDFGLARIESSTLTAAGEVLGSASYMPPEVVLGQPADARSDVFSLGVVAYELMTGERPFGGATISKIIHNIVRETPRSAHGLNLAVPPDYDEIFYRVLSKDPKARYALAREFASDLMLKRWADRDPTLTATWAGGQTELARAAAVAAVSAVAGAGPAEAASAGEATMMTFSAEEVAGPGDPGSATAMIIDRDGVLAGVRTNARSGEAAEVVEIDGDEPLAALVSEVPPPSMSSEPTPATPSPSAGAHRAGVGLKLGLSLAGAALVCVAVAAAGLYWLTTRVLQAPPSSPVALPATAQTTLPAAATTTVEAAAIPETAAVASTDAAASAARPKPTGVLSITSEPAGARVTVGRAARGRTPVRVEVAPGTWAVVVEKDGFKPWRREVRVAAGAQDVRAALEASPTRPTVAPPSSTLPAAGQVVPLGAGVTPPRKVSGSSPALPRDAQRRRLTGSVLVEFVVTEDGRVEDAKVLESAGDVLDRACLDAVGGWRYAPATLRGSPVRTKQQARFTFVAR
jgi:TonB family protein